MVIVIGASDEIRLVTERGAYTGRCLLVSPNVSRSIEVNNATGLYSIQLDPASRLSQYLRRQCQLEGGAVEWRDEKEYLAVSRFPFSIRSHQLRGALVLPLQP